MKTRRRVLLLAAAICILGPTEVRAQSFTLSGGLDLRAGLLTHPRLESVTGLSSLFVNFRKVLADEAGDRFILVGQVDVEEEIANTRFYNTYGQYKGPLGKWNVRVGRYLVPFGLHAYYDTERLLLAAHEAEVLGTKLAQGVELLGFAGSFDYAASMNRSPWGGVMPAVRFGWQGEDVRVGLSYLYGLLPSFSDRESAFLDELLPGARPIEKHRVAIDYEHALGPLMLRLEPVAGIDESSGVFGGYAEVAFALSPRWEIAANAAALHSGLVGDQWRSGVSLGFRLLPTVFIRSAYLHRDDFGSPSDMFVAQLYADFSQSFGD